MTTTCPVNDPPPSSGWLSRRPRHAFAAALFAALLLAGCGSSDKPATEAVTAAPQAAAPAPPVAETAQSALAQANIAFRENRIVEPAGNNALEHAMRALQIDPKNAGANEILVDLTPIAASAIEADIAAGDFAEAERVMALLAAANPGSLTVQSLQRKLATATRPAPVAPEPAAVAATASEVAATTSASTPAAAAPAAAQPQPAAASIAAEERSAPPTTRNTAPAPAAAPPVASASNGAGVPPTAATTRPSAPVAASASAGRASEPVPLVKVSPDYPPAAKKRRTEGWVELQFLVGVDGVPRQIEVVRAQPAGMFDRAAVRAMSRWKFKPAERDGQAVEARAKTTVGFKLG